MHNLYSRTFLLSAMGNFSVLFNEKTVPRLRANQYPSNLFKYGLGSFPYLLGHEEISLLDARCVASLYVFKPSSWSSSSVSSNSMVRLNTSQPLDFALCNHLWQSLGSAK